jgi:hypothetical protein
MEHFFSAWRILLRQPVYEHLRNELNEHIVSIIGKEFVCPAKEKYS